jgi:ABC-type Fe3+-siderophore transport system permease subunit
MAAWCVGFAVVNVVLESTGHLAEGEYADHADAFTVMNWLVVGLKLLAAGVAVLSVTRRPVGAPRVLGVAVWGAFATVGVYALGSVVQAIGMVAGLGGSADEIDALDVGYLLFFLAAAVGWAVLATSYSKRHALGPRVAALGMLGAPVVLGFLLVVMPMVLTHLGLMPAS